MLCRPATGISNLKRSLEVIKKLMRLFREHWLALIAATIVVAPIAFTFTRLLYDERIRILEQQVQTQATHIELLREEKTFLERKLAQPAASEPRPTTGTTSPVDSSPAGDSNSGTTAARLPVIENPAKLMKDEVRDLARFYGLFERTKTNPHLRFKEGDISYWYEQNLTEDELKLEFETRRRVLERANQQGRRIPSQGDLSHSAEQLQRLHRGG